MRMQVTLNPIMRLDLCHRIDHPASSNVPIPSVNHFPRNLLHLAVPALHAVEIVLHDLLAALAEVLPQRLLHARVHRLVASCCSPAQTA